TLATLANYALTSRRAGRILAAGFRSRAPARLEGVGCGDEEDQALAPAEGVTPRSLVRRVLAAKLSNPFRRAAGFLVLDIGSSSVKLAAVLAEAGHLIPDSLDNVNLDYQVIDLIEAGNKMEVLVVAVKKEIINSYTNAIRAADLEPVVVDVDYFALENMFELNYDPPGGHP